MDRVDKTAEDFNNAVPYGEEAFMVLRAHLLVERELFEYVKWRIDNPELFDEISSNQAISGSTLILLAQALSLRDECPPVGPLFMKGKFWSTIKMLNKIRNKLAHTLTPNREQLEKQMIAFVEMAQGEKYDPKINLNQYFFAQARRLVALIANDRYPITQSGKYINEILKGREEDE